MTHDWQVIESGAAKTYYCPRCGLRKKETSHGVYYEKPGGLWTKILWPMRMPGCEDKPCMHCNGTGKT